MIVTRWDVLTTPFGRSQLGEDMDNEAGDERIPGEDRSGDRRLRGCNAGRQGRHLAGARPRRGVARYPRRPGTRLSSSHRRPAHGNHRGAQERGPGGTRLAGGRDNEGGGEITKAYLRMGRPSEEILSLSEEIIARLIVVGNQGLGRTFSRMKRFLMGSVSEKVSRYARCSVMVVRRDLYERRKV